MGDQTMCDVEKRIEQWRNALRASDAFGTSDIEELESHLREEMSQLRRLGLSETESFLIARHRLGATSTLEAEYEKINPDRRSLLRLSWMAAGVLIYLLAGYVAVGVSHGGILAALPLRMGVTSLALVGVVTKAIAAVVLLLLVWMGFRHWSWTRLSGRLLTMSRPRWILLLGGLAIVDVALIGFDSLFRIAAVRCLNLEEYSRMALVTSFAGLGWGILAPIVAALLVIVLRTRADRYRHVTL
jgi:hypothetical protein